VDEDRGLWVGCLMLAAVAVLALAVGVALGQML